MIADVRSTPRRTCSPAAEVERLREQVERLLAPDQSRGVTNPAIGALGHPAAPAEDGDASDLAGTAADTCTRAPCLPVRQYCALRIFDLR